MGSIILIVPILVFSVWMLSTTGRRVFEKKRAKGKLSLDTPLLDDDESEVGEGDADE